MAQVWVVSGAPLPGGTGWRIWYARRGTEAYRPRPVSIRTPRGEAVPHRRDVNLLDPLEGFPRRVALVDLKLNEPRPGETFRLSVPEVEGRFTWQTLPSRIPTGGFSLIFSSCFWQYDDREGHLLKTLQTVLRLEDPTPAFKFMIGDQIYLDFPVPLDLREDSPQLIGSRYRRYWGDEPYRRALSSTPNFFLCDDHEFWNNYPERQAHLPHTWSGAWRREYGEWADRYYRVFQRYLNPKGQQHPWIQFDLLPVSFFAADSRSERTDFADGDRGFFAEPQWEALESWQEGLEGPGVLVLGQPLFQHDGDWKDYSLSNFQRDYVRLMELIERSFAGENREGRPHDILVLSGDIHTGRHATATLPQFPGVRLHELIASSSSRVGPFLSEPSPVTPPGRLPESYRPGPDQPPKPWTIHRESGLPFLSVENNLGVLRLYPARREPYRVRAEFGSYRVRPHRRPAWKFWVSEPDHDPGQGESFHLYEKKDIYLR